MRVSDPVAYLFENTDPEGSLQANVTNTTVRCLSNMPLDSMMQNRHHMSREVRSEVSPKSESWGYSLGSVYIRKVHFRDAAMIHQIEQKVVNRLRQVTSAIRQAGDNQVDIIKSKAEREASIEFAKAQAVRPRLVGKPSARSDAIPRSSMRSSTCSRPRKSSPAAPKSSSCPRAAASSRPSRPSEKCPAARRRR